jgi:hypothetical protein
MRARCVRGSRGCVGPSHTSEPAPFRLSIPPPAPALAPRPSRVCAQADCWEERCSRAALRRRRRRRRSGGAAAAVVAAAAAAAAAAQIKVRRRWLAKEERGAKGCRRARATHAQHANAHATRTRVHVHRTRTCGTRTHSTRARTPHTTARTHTSMHEGAANDGGAERATPARQGEARATATAVERSGAGCRARGEGRGTKGRGRRATGDGRCERNATERVTVGEEHKAMSADMGGI